MVFYNIIMPYVIPLRFASFRVVFYHYCRISPSWKQDRRLYLYCINK